MIVGTRSLTDAHTAKFGDEADEFEDGIVIYYGRPLASLKHGASIHCYDDHVAMAFAMLATVVDWHAPSRRLDTRGYSASPPFRATSFVLTLSSSSCRLGGLAHPGTCAAPRPHVLIAPSQERPCPRAASPSPPLRATSPPWQPLAPLADPPSHERTATLQSLARVFLMLHATACAYRMYTTCIVLQ